MPPAHTPLLTTRQRPSRTCASAQPRTYFDTTYVLSKQGRTYIHASTTLRLKFSLRLAPLASVRKSRSSRRTSAAPGPILALIYAENPAGAAAVALGPTKRVPGRSPAARSRPRPPRSYLRCRSGRSWSHRRSSCRARRAPCEPRAMLRLMRRLAHLLPWRLLKSAAAFCHCRCRSARSRCTVSSVSSVFDWRSSIKARHGWQTVALYTVVIVRTCEKEFYTRSGEKEIIPPWSTCSDVHKQRTHGAPTPPPPTQLQNPPPHTRHSQ